MNVDHCIFCRIIAQQAPAKILYEDSQVIAFQDAHPIAPVHVLIVPKQHIVSVNDMKEEDEKVIGHLSQVAGQLAEQLGVSQSGYRLVINTGPDAGQSVFHLHMHLIGGRHLPFKFD
jgi:histidine triad (HIT) family protein